MTSGRSPTEILSSVTTAHDLLSNVGIPACVRVLLAHIALKYEPLVPFVWHSEALAIGLSADMGEIARWHPAVFASGIVQQLPTGQLVIPKGSPLEVAFVLGQTKAMFARLEAARFDLAQARTASAAALAEARNAEALIVSQQGEVAALRAQNGALQARIDELEQNLEQMQKIKRYTNDAGAYNADADPVLIQARNEMNALLGTAQPQQPTTPQPQKQIAVQVAPSVVPMTVPMPAKISATVQPADPAADAKAAAKAVRSNRKGSKATAAAATTLPQESSDMAAMRQAHETARATHGALASGMVQPLLDADGNIMRGAQGQIIYTTEMSTDKKSDKTMFPDDGTVADLGTADQSDA